MITQSPILLSFVLELPDSETRKLNAYNSIFPNIMTSLEAALYDSENKKSYKVSFVLSFVGLNSLWGGPP